MAHLPRRYLKPFKDNNGKNLRVIKDVFRLSNYYEYIGVVPKIFIDVILLILIIIVYFVLRVIDFLDYLLNFIF